MIRDSISRSGNGKENPLICPGREEEYYLTRSKYQGRTEEDGKGGKILLPVLQLISRLWANKNLNFREESDEEDDPGLATRNCGKFSFSTFQNFFPPFSSLEFKILCHRIREWHFHKILFVTCSLISSTNLCVALSAGLKMMQWSLELIIEMTISHSTVLNSVKSTSVVIGLHTLLVLLAMHLYWKRQNCFYIGIAKKQTSMLVAWIWNFR